MWVCALECEHVYAKCQQLYITQLARRIAAGYTIIFPVYWVSNVVLEMKWDWCQKNTFFTIRLRQKKKKCDDEKEGNKSIIYFSYKGKLIFLSNQKKRFNLRNYF